jgi:Mg2+/citrate symporter
MLTGILLLVAFLLVVFAIVRGQSPIIMLLLLAIVWALLAGIGINDIQSKILQGGGVQYASAVIIIVFGAWFAQVLIQTGIAESVIRSAVELTGDRPMGECPEGAAPVRVADQPAWAVANDPAGAGADSATRRSNPLAISQIARTIS